jgi:DNA replication protein DnaC
VSTNEPRRLFEPSGRLSDPSTRLPDPPGRLSDPSTRLPDPPGRLSDPPGRLPGESIEDWFRRTIGPIPAATALDTDTPAVDVDASQSRKREALAALERTIQPIYRWARFSAPELAERVPKAAIAQAEDSWRESRVCLVGASRAGKTSLGVAMLRQWVAANGRAAAFVPAYKLPSARLQHPAGHGEPEVVELAFKAPLVLLDDLGSERDHVSSPIPDILFDRHAEGRPTWVTTGLTREQLVGRYGLGVVARIFERAKLIRVGESVTTKTLGCAGDRAVPHERPPCSG